MVLPDTLNRPSVLIAARSPHDRFALADMLSPLYALELAGTTQEAWVCLGTQGLPDLVLLDEDFSEDSPSVFCKQWKALPATRTIPVIVLRGQGSTVTESLAAELGIDECLVKPVDPTALRHSVAHQLQLSAAVRATKSGRGNLEQEIDQRSREISILKEIAVLTMASLAEIRHLETESHARRTQNYVMALADHLASHRRFADQLDPEARALLRNSVPLHDIGKIGVPDAILLKAGPLSPDEREIMKTHTTLGRDAIQRAEDRLGVHVPFLAVIKELTYCHHERWDGHGYPEGKAGDDIPLSARLMAVADVYDALITRRVYKEPMSHDQVVAYIEAKRSTDFDPDITDAFVQMQAKFRDISNRFSRAGESSH